MSDTMQLWILRPQEGLSDDDNPWNPWYDKTFGFVVRAKSEGQARDLAHHEGGDENRGQFLKQQIANTTSPWLDALYSSCLPLTNEGDEGVVMRDFASA